LLARHPIFAELMVWEADSERGAVAEDTIIAVTAIPSEDYLNDTLGEGWTDEQAGKLLWEAVDAVNSDQPMFKKIRKVYLRREPFDVTTKRTIKRFVPENKNGLEV